jgi:hypothetical protein
VCFVSFRTRGCGRYPSARYSLRPLIGRVRKFLANLGHIGPRVREIVSKRHCEERSDEAIHSFLSLYGLLRFARNDGLRLFEN